MQVALLPSVAADLRLAAEERLISRLETISLGERTTLAKRASGRVAGALLLDTDERVMRAALENGRVTETAVVRALKRRDAQAILVNCVCRHAKWSLRQEVRVALLSNEMTPLGCAYRFVCSLSVAVLRDLLRSSHLPQPAKRIIQEQIAIQSKA